jgi:hypothetical protein
VTAKNGQRHGYDLRLSIGRMTAGTFASCTDPVHKVIFCEFEYFLDFVKSTTYRFGVA